MESNNLWFRAHSSVRDISSLQEELPADRTLLDLLFNLHPTWPPAGKTAMSLSFSVETRDRFTPLQPVVGILSPPHYFSDRDPALALYLITRESPLTVPFASVVFANGRRMLEIFRLLLDTEDQRTKYELIGGILVQPGLTLTTRHLIERALRDFPRLGVEGERVRTRALKDFHGNSPS